MTAPALETIGHDLKICRPFEQSIVLSVFVLAYAFGPFLAGPSSELYGRRPVLQIFNLVYLVFNTACGFAKTGPQMIVCRFFAGFGGRYVSNNLPMLIDGTFVCSSADLIKRCYRNRSGRPRRCVENRRKRFINKPIYFDYTSISNIRAYPRWIHNPVQFLAVDILVNQYLGRDHSACCHALLTRNISTGSPRPKSG